MIETITVCHCALPALQGPNACENCSRNPNHKTSDYRTFVTNEKTVTTYDDVKNELLARIVNNSPICQNCDIYRDGWNVCFMASECLTNGFKFSKRRKDGGENG